MAKKSYKSLIVIFSVRQRRKLGGE